MNYMNVLNDFKTRLTQELDRNFIHLQLNATGLRRSFNGYLARMKRLSTCGEAFIEAVFTIVPWTLTERSYNWPSGLQVFLYF